MLKRPVGVKIKRELSTKAPMGSTLVWNSNARLPMMHALVVIASVGVAPVEAAGGPRVSAGKHKDFSARKESEVSYCLKRLVTYHLCTPCLARHYWM
jgi:hypothetical protein